MDLRLTHLHTRVVQSGLHDTPCCGQTLWARTGDEATAGVAWDWIQLHQGVVALADPMGLVTNLMLLDAQGDPIPTLQAALHLNEIVHALPWQTEVERALARMAA
ncbi:MAG: hypothetical protein QFE16_02920 [Pseudomonadota bacterium]|jgi:hypothetical protein|nr:hypothetical protein [Pseudomonadota bacterium]